MPHYSVNSAVNSMADIRGSLSTMPCCCTALTSSFVLLFKSDVQDARVRERPASLPSSTTARFLLEPEHDVPEEITALDLWGTKTACGGEG
jgi:hypothetical protein